MKNQILRKCRGCNQIKDRNELIKITLVDNELILNPNSKQVGRSVYICNNASCIKALIKNKGIKKALKFNNEDKIKEIEALLLN